MTLIEYFPKVFSINIHQITTSGGKFNIFSGEDTDKNTAQNAPKHAISNLPFPPNPLPLRRVSPPYTCYIT